MKQTTERAMHILLSVVFVLVTFDALTNSPQGFMFSLLIGAYLGRNILKRCIAKLPLQYAFILSGLVAGLMIEVFAIFENAEFPAKEKVLLHPDPLIDLLIACFWYGGFMCVWYILLRRKSFSKKTVYVYSALYGVCTESGIFTLFTTGILGILLTIITTAAYGIFPLIAYFLTEERFAERVKPKLKDHGQIIFFFILFWAFIGNFVYNPLITLFPKGF